MGNERANFSTRSRSILAQRSAYRCSNPHCGILTVGPGNKIDDVAITGTGAHIYAAAAGGPRGTSGLSWKERSSISNGIWLCASCGRLVDTNEGEAYPAALLRSWKDLHEARVRLELGGHARPIGWIQSLEVDEHFLLSPCVIQFSRCNLIVGGNGYGKTLLVSLMESLLSPGASELSAYGLKGRIAAKMNWYDPNPRSAEIDLTNDLLSYRVDGHEVFFPPQPCRMITLREPYGLTSRGMGGIKDIARRLGVPPWVAVNGVSRIPDVMGGDITETRIDDDGVSIRLSGYSEIKPIDLLPGGFRSMFFTQLIVTLGEVQARAEPTILLLDAELDGADEMTRKKMLGLLSSPARTFQTIVTSVRPFAVGHEWNVLSLNQEQDRKTNIIQGNL